MLLIPVTAFPLLNELLALTFINAKVILQLRILHNSSYFFQNAIAFPGNFGNTF